MAMTKQQLIDAGINPKCISIETCNKCRGILVGQKPYNFFDKPRLTCVDCGTSYTIKD